MGACKSTTKPTTHVANPQTDPVALSSPIQVNMNLLQPSVHEKNAANPFGSRSNYGVSFEAGNGDELSLRYAEDWLKEIKRIVDAEMRAREEHMHIFGN